MENDDIMEIDLPTDGVRLNCSCHITTLGIFPAPLCTNLATHATVRPVMDIQDMFRRGGVESNYRLTAYCDHCWQSHLNSKPAADGGQE